MENIKQQSKGLPTSPEDAKQAAEALMDYLGSGSEGVATVLKLIHLNNAVAKKAIGFVQHTDEKLANQIKGDFLNYANGLEDIAIKLFSGYVYNLVDGDEAFNFD